MKKRKRKIRRRRRLPAVDWRGEVERRQRAEEKEQEQRRWLMLRQFVLAIETANFPPEHVVVGARMDPSGRLVTLQFSMLQLNAIAAALNKIIPQP